jgi:hypothetical protein
MKFINFLSIFVGHFDHLDPDPDCDSDQIRSGSTTLPEPDTDQKSVYRYSTAAVLMWILTCFGRLLPDIMLEREPRIPCPPYTRAAGRLLILKHLYPAIQY